MARHLLWGLLLLIGDLARLNNLCQRCPSGLFTWLARLLSSLQLSTLPASSPGKVDLSHESIANGLKLHAFGLFVNKSRPLDHEIDMCIIVGNYVTFHGYVIARVND